RVGGIKGEDHRGADFARCSSRLLASREPDRTQPTRNAGDCPLQEGCGSGGGERQFRGTVDWRGELDLKARVVRGWVHRDAPDIERWQRTVPKRHIRSDETGGSV